MKVVILAGGFGTRISEESHLRPKPMIEIGGKPILWHIMKIYTTFGFNEFIICLGYKGYVIKEYFANYYLHASDITFDFSNANSICVHNNVSEPWKVTLIDTGLYTLTGGRVKAISKYIGNEPFMLTYGDGVADVDLNELLDYHNKHGKIATMTAVQPGGRFGVIEMNSDNQIDAFREKTKADGGWINGGFMILQPEVMNYLPDHDVAFEQQPLKQLAEDGELLAFKHTGFWQCMDTQRDKVALENLWHNKKAPWVVW